MAAFEPQKLTLSYWNGRGLMEVPRLLLAINGQFPSDGSWVDDRRSAPPSDGDANLGRLPFITTESGESVGQSLGCFTLIATRVGMMGDSAVEMATILAVKEHLREMSDAYYKLMPYGSEPTAELQEKWFTTGAGDISAGTPADGSKRPERFFKWYAGRIENALTGASFAVGNRLSLADVMLYNQFAETLALDQRPSPDHPSHKCEPMGSAKQVSAALAGCKKINTAIAAVAGNKNAQRWWAERGVQGF